MAHQLNGIMDKDYVKVLVETNKGSRNRYVWEESAKQMRFNRTLFHNMRYPAEYGFIENTIDEDNKPLDALVLIDEPTFPGCLIHARPIGIFKIFEENTADHKVICVPIEDPRWNKIYHLDEVNPDLMKEIEFFFEAYVRFESQKVDIEGWQDSSMAQKVLEKASERYHAQFAIFTEG
ncbi:inorganic diphosphatase [Persicobacter psychrovividus]|uniref:inorganic diphosphatase n=1 Tax=Persicobacter psychrovividus TaxID=387638 RepID=A0ABN6L8M5_9BACT|nr:inorganic pyrophosphatase [Persicobacter psychrovividus]